jgi:hypothetical protein
MNTLKKLLLIFSIHFLIFCFILYYFNHQSGGDLGIAIFGILSYLLYVIICFVIGIKWNISLKLYMLATLIILAVVEFSIFNYLIALNTR